MGLNEHFRFRNALMYLMNCYCHSDSPLGMEESEARHLLFQLCERVATKQSTPQESLEPKTLNALAAEAHANAVKNGWWGTEATHKEDFLMHVALLHSEVAEVDEDFRRGKHWTCTHWEEEGTKPCGIPIELADIILVVLSMAAEFNVDIEKAVQQKMAYNEVRPNQRGGKKGGAEHIGITYEVEPCSTDVSEGEEKKGGVNSRPSMPPPPPPKGQGERS